MKNSQVRIFAMLILFLFVLFCTIWGLTFNNKIFRLISINRPHFWAVQIAVPTRTVEENRTLIVRPLEHIIRPLDEMKSTIIETKRDEIMLYFYTEQGINSGIFSRKLSESLKTLTDLPGLSDISIHIVSDLLRTPSNNTLIIDNHWTPLSYAFKEKLFSIHSLQQDKNWHIRNIKSPDFLFDLTSKNSLFLNLSDKKIKSFLNAITAIEGIDFVAVKNFEIDTFELTYNSINLSLLGISPSEFNSHIESKLTSNFSSHKQVFARAPNIMESKAGPIDTLMNTSLLTNSRREVPLFNLSQSSITKRICKFLPYPTTQSELQRARCINEKLIGTDKSLENSQISIWATEGFDTQKINTKINDILDTISHDAKIKSENHSAFSFVQYPKEFYFLSFFLLTILFKNSFGNESTLKIHSTRIMLAVLYFINFHFLVGIINTAETNVIFFTCLIISQACLAVERHRPQSKKKKLISHLNLYSVFTLFGIGTFVGSMLITKSFGMLDDATFFGILMATSSVSLSHLIMPKSRLEKTSSNLSFADKNWIFTTAASTLALFLISIFSSTLRPSEIKSDTAFVNINSNQELKPQTLQKIGISLTQQFESSSKNEIIGPTSSPSIILSPVESTLDLDENPLALLEKYLPSFSAENLGWIQITDKLANQTKDLSVVSTDLALNPKNSQKTPDLAKVTGWLSSVYLNPKFSAKNPNGEMASKLQNLFAAHKIHETKNAYRQNEANALFLKFNLNNTGNFENVFTQKMTEIENMDSGKLHYHFDSLSDASNNAMQTWMKILLFELFFFFFIFAAVTSSTRRALLAVITIATAYAILFGVHSMFQLYNLSSEYTLLNNAMLLNSNAIFFLASWASCNTTGHSIRKANRKLKDAYLPMLQLIMRVRIFVVCLFLVGITLFYFGKLPINIAIIFISTAIFWMIFLPGWLMVWSVLAEYRSRLFLKINVYFKQICIFMALSFASFNICAEAQQGLATINTSCGNIVTTILPIVGRPKGKEPAPVKSIFSEKLSQETPCSYIDNSLLKDITNATQEHRKSGEQYKLIAALNSIVSLNRGNIEAKNKSASKERGSIGVSTTRIYGGFYEEFYGNIAFTILEFRENAAPIVLKMTVSEANQTVGIAKIASLLRGESFKIVEDLLGESRRLPVFIAPVESLDKNNISENLSQEMEMYIRSRLLYPLSTDLLERKVFFRPEEIEEKANHKLYVKIRRDGTKFYASIEAKNVTDRTTRSAWIEGDLSQLPNFEEEVLFAAQKILAINEGIADYGIVMGLDVWWRTSEITKMYALTLRQNLGNAAFSLRMRSGDRSVTNRRDMSHSLFLIGSALGWQFADRRWVVADAGLGIDIGFSTLNLKNSASTRSILFSYGPFVQTQMTYSKSFSFLARGGIELPGLFNSQNRSDAALPNYVINASLGLGITF